MEPNEQKPAAGLEALGGMTKQLDGANPSLEEQARAADEKKKARPPRRRASGRKSRAWSAACSR
jgi:hypothetical protein